MLKFIGMLTCAVLLQQLMDVLCCVCVTCLQVTRYPCQ
jgi:hypothetical protein